MRLRKRQKHETDKDQHPSGLLPPWSELARAFGSERLVARLQRELEQTPPTPDEANSLHTSIRIIELGHGLQAFVSETTMHQSQAEGAKTWCRWYLHTRPDNQPRGAVTMMAELMLRAGFAQQIPTSHRGSKWLWGPTGPPFPSSGSVLALSDAYAAHAEQRGKQWSQQHQNVYCEASETELAETTKTGSQELERLVELQTEFYDTITAAAISAAVEVSETSDKETTAGLRAYTDCLLSALAAAHTVSITPERSNPVSLEWYEQAAWSVIAANGLAYGLIAHWDRAASRLSHDEGVSPNDFWASAGFHALLSTIQTLGEELSVARFLLGREALPGVPSQRDSLSR